MDVSLPFVFAQTTPGAGASQLLLFVVIIGIFYAVVFLPLRKQRKNLQKMIDEIQRGDKVVTNGGLYGEVAAVETTTVLLKIADNVKVRVAKSAIAGKQGEEEPGGAR